MAIGTGDSSCVWRGWNKRLRGRRREKGLVHHVDKAAGNALKL